MCVELGLRRPSFGDFSPVSSNNNSVNNGGNYHQNVGSLGGNSRSLRGVSVSYYDGDINDAETLDEGKDLEASVDDLLDIDLGNGGGFDFD